MKLPNNFRVTIANSATGLAFLFTSLLAVILVVHFIASEPLAADAVKKTIKAAASADDELLLNVNEDAGAGKKKPVAKKSPPVKKAAAKNASNDEDDDAFMEELASENARDIVIYDPFEPFNRAIFSFNRTVDGVLFEPLARGYEFITPSWTREAVDNFSNNLSEPVTFVNSLLQGDVESAFTSFWRFTPNSTIGLGGLIDQAELAGLDEKSLNFSSTLGYYGIGAGPYIIIPLRGPNTLRGLVGEFVDAPFDPIYYTHFKVRLGVTAVQAVDARASFLDAGELLDKAADPYVAMRAVYAQSINDDGAEGEDGSVVGVEDSHLMRTSTGEGIGFEF